jgi:hypothetical protein
MKAQVSLEFILCVIIFTILATYVLLQLTNVKSRYLRYLTAEKLNSELYLISELLINDVGEPANWHLAPEREIKRIGLMDERTNATNLLSFSKLERLNSICIGNYDLVRKALGVENHFSLGIVNATEVLVTCAPFYPTPFKGFNFSIRRSVAINNARITHGKLILSMW